MGIMNPWPPDGLRSRCVAGRGLWSPGGIWTKQGPQYLLIPDLMGAGRGYQVILAEEGRAQAPPRHTPPSSPSLLNESRKSLVWLNAAACSHLLLCKALSAHSAPTGSVSRPRHSISRHVGFGDPGQEDRDSVDAGGDPSELSCQPSSSPCVMHSDPHSLAASVRTPSHQCIPEGDQRLILAHPSKGLGSSFA